MPFVAALLPTFTKGCDMRRRLTGWIAGCVLVATTAGVARADPHDVRLPLRDGRLTTAALTDVLPKSVAARLPAGSVDVRSWRGSLFVAALNTSLGQGCHVTVDRDAVVVRIDPDKLPHDWDDTRLAVRTFTATAAPVGHGGPGEALRPQIAGKVVDVSPGR